MLYRTYSITAQQQKEVFSVYQNRCCLSTESIILVMKGIILNFVTVVMQAFFLTTVTSLNVNYDGNKMIQPAEILPIKKVIVDDWRLMNTNDENVVAVASTTSASASASTDGTSIRGSSMQNRNVQSCDVCTRGYLWKGCPNKHYPDIFADWGSYAKPGESTCYSNSCCSSKLQFFGCCNAKPNIDAPSRSQPVRVPIKAPKPPAPKRVPFFSRAAGKAVIAILASVFGGLVCVGVCSCMKNQSKDENASVEESKGG
jgi:hypothetical protein